MSNTISAASVSLLDEHRQLLIISDNTKRSLVFEFSCDMVLELYNTLDDWSGVFERMLSGRDALALAKAGDKITGYQIDNFTPDETIRLYDELKPQ